MRTTHGLSRRLVDTYVPTPLELLARLRPTRRQVKLFIIVFSIIMLAGAIYASAAHAAAPLPCFNTHTCKQTQVMQPGELIPLRDLSEGGTKTLFETYPYGAWYFDTDVDFNAFDGSTYLPTIMNGLVNLLGYLWVLVVYLAVGLSWWLFSSLNVPGLSDAVTSMLGGASGVVLQWLFPTALAVGGLVAYVEGRRVKGSYYSQIAWMVAAGVLAVGLTSAPGTFVTGVDTVRDTGANLILSASNNAISTNDKMPFTWKAVDYSVNTPSDAMLRKSADSIWRSQVATPWCLVEFGSVQACQLYGKDILNAGMDTSKRKDIIQNEIYPTEGNGDPSAGKKSPTGQWVAGQEWPQRLGMVLLALVLAIVFCALLLVLGFSALAGVILTYLLLFAGVFFACLWLIPGKLRQWGVAWAETLIGAVLITLVALLTFGATLAILTALLAATANSGWMVSMGLALTLMFVAFGFRNKLAEIVGAHSTGAGRAFLVGAFVTRSASRAIPAAGRRGVSAVKGTAKGTAAATRGAARGTAAAGRGTATAARDVAGGIRGGSQWVRNTASYVTSAARVAHADRRNAAGKLVTPSTIRRGGLRPGPRASETRPTSSTRTPSQRPAAGTTRSAAPQRSTSTSRQTGTPASRPVSNRLRRHRAGDDR
ncbi:hypothetical protein [Humibacter ginsengiterrae]